jgi:hypothetical protein
MKKLLVVLMVLAFVAPAMADDTLDASGSMRVEAYSISNNGFGDDDSQDLDYWDQRFRMQLRFTPADGVSATVRTDITEDTWGKLQGGHRRRRRFPSGPGCHDTGTTTAGGANGILMIDRAYLSIDKGMVNINAGLNTFNLGNGHAYNNQGQGIRSPLKPLWSSVLVTPRNLRMAPTATRRMPTKISTPCSPISVSKTT